MDIKPNNLRCWLTKPEAEALVAYVNREMVMPAPCFIDPEVIVPGRFTADPTQVHAVLIADRTMEYPTTVRTIRMTAADFIAGYRAAMKDGGR